MFEINTPSNNLSSSKTKSRKGRSGKFNQCFIFPSPHSHRYRPLRNSSAAPECVAAVAPAVVVVIVIVFDATEMVAPLVVVVGSAECMMELQNQIKSPLALSLPALSSVVRGPWSVRPLPSPPAASSSTAAVAALASSLLSPHASVLLNRRRRRAAAFVWPPTVPLPPPPPPTATTVSLDRIARPLARPVGGCRISCYGTVTVVEIIVRPTKPGFPARAVS